MERWASALTPAPHVATYPAAAAEHFPIWGETQVPEPAVTESPEARRGTAERMRASIEAISAQAGADANDIGPRADSGPLSLGLSQSSLTFPPLPPPAAAAGERALIALVYEQAL